MTKAFRSIPARTISCAQPASTDVTPSLPAAMSRGYADPQQVEEDKASARREAGLGPNRTNAADIRDLDAGSLAWNEWVYAKRDRGDRGVHVVVGAY